MSKLLSSGGYGCVFYPAFDCNSKILTEKYVSKVQKNNFSSDNEINISFLIKKIKNYEKYFEPIISSCKLNLRKVNKKNIDINKCELINNFKSNNYISLKLHYFDSYKIKYVNNFLVNSKIQLFLFMSNSYKFLLECLIHLYSINVVHFDLKSDNILFDKNTLYPKIIDFGISIPLDKLNFNNIKNYFYIFAPDYYLWCLEIHFINFLLHEKNTLNKYDIKIVTEKYYDNYFFNKINKNIVDNLIKSSIDFFSQYIGKNKEKIIKNLLTFNYSWDNYSLSILYLTMIDDKQLKMYNLLINNISPNPNYRLTLNNTFDKFNEILIDLDFNVIYIEYDSDLLTRYNNTITKFEKKILNNL